jgi:hypothetical protein
MYTHTAASVCAHVRACMQVWDLRTHKCLQTITQVRRAGCCVALCAPQAAASAVLGCGCGLIRLCDHAAHARCQGR